jgi:hypothetical protein
VPFAHGGVLSSWPLRFCVEVEDAVGVARRFVQRDGELPAAVAPTLTGVDHRMTMTFCASAAGSL